MSTNGKVKGEDAHHSCKNKNCPRNIEVQASSYSRRPMVFELQETTQDESLVITPVEPTVLSWLSNPSVDLSIHHDLLKSKGFVQFAHVQKFAKVPREKQEQFLEKWFGEGESMSAVDRFFLLEALGELGDGGSL